VIVFPDDPLETALRGRRRASKRTAIVAAETGRRRPEGAIEERSIADPSRPRSHDQYRGRRAADVRFATKEAVLFDGREAMEVSWRRSSGSAR